MSLTLRSAALFYRGATENIGYGDIVPYLDGIEATGHSTIIGTGDFVTLIEEVSGSGDSHLADGRVDGLLDTIAGSGTSEYGIFGDMAITPLRDMVHIEGSLPFSLGNIMQAQEVSGYGSSQSLVGIGRVRPHPCVVSSAGNSAYIACKGPGVFNAPLERINGFGYAGSAVGAGDVREKLHSTRGAGSSSWTLAILGSGSVAPSTDNIDGIGTSGYVAALAGSCSMTGLRNVVSGSGFFQVAGSIIMLQPASISANGTVGAALGNLGFSRDNAVAVSTQPAPGLPFEFQRPSTTSTGGQPPTSNPELLEFSR